MTPWDALALCGAIALVSEMAAVLRRGARGFLGYLLLLGANLTLLGWVMRAGRITRAGGGPTVELVGGLSACALLVVGPAVIGVLLRRALGDEDFAAAARLSGLRELLVPGRASALEREFFEQIAAARAGRADEVVRALRQQLVEAEPPLDEGIQERIVTVLLFGERHREAITQWETHLGAEPARHPALAVQLVKAYGALGDLEKAAELVHALEERLHPDDPTAMVVLQQARLSLLAQAGALAEMERLLQHPSLAWMQPRARAALLDTARARARSATPPAPAPDGAAVASGADAATPAGVPLAPLVPIADRHLALYLEGVALRAGGDLQELGRSRRLPPATLSLVAANLLGFALFTLLLGAPEQLDHVVRGGAGYLPALRAGEWWRLWTALFVHAGWLHLVFDAVALFLVGRIVEPLIGAPRLLVVYGLAGLGGNLAAAANPAPEVLVTLGASGAVAGLLAALAVLLVLAGRARTLWPAAWRRQVLQTVLALLVVQLAIAVLVGRVDSLVGGLVVGGLTGALVMPGGLLGRGRAAQLVLASLLAVLGATAVRSLLSLAVEQPGETMARLPRHDERLGPLRLAVPPATARRNPGSADEYLDLTALGIQVTASLLSPSPGAEQVLGERVAADNAQAAGAGPVEPAAAPAIEGWPARAAQLHAKGDLLLYYARPTRLASTPPGPPGVVLVRLLQPRDPVVTPLIAAELTRLLVSVRLDGEPP